DVIKTDERLHDCGFVCVKLGLHDRHVAYNGLRFLRFESKSISDPQPIIDREYRSAGLAVPTFDADVLNHDGWWCRTVQACPKCARGEPSNTFKRRPIWVASGLARQHCATSSDRQQLHIAPVAFLFPA